MRIYKLEIKNFRGIKSAEITLEKSLICLIGAGDSTKTTILDAIEYVLSPNWFIPLNDSDFTDCNIYEDISIAATIGPVPEELKSDNRWGLHLRAWDYDNHKIIDEPDDASHVRVITIKLTIDSTLTPEWFVVTDRNPEGKHISYRDREKFGVSLLGANIENELSWTRGSSLSRLTTDRHEADKTILEAGRKLREVVKAQGLNELKISIKQVKEAAKELGIKLDDLKANIDPASLRGRAATLSLHNGNVPVRRMGLGSKRLLAIGSQLQCIEGGAILLVDEIEYALEPYRIKHLVRKLKEYTDGGKIGVGQIIMTTHSPAVLQELGAEPLFVVHNEGGNTTVKGIGKEAQGAVRRIPEAFLAVRVIVCEGATEVGLLRAYENKVIKDYKKSFALNRIVVVDGEGGSAARRRAKILFEHGYEVCVLLDSDKEKKSEELPDGIKAILWSNETSTEQRIANDFPQNRLSGLLELAIKVNSKHKILDNLNDASDGPKIEDVSDILKQSDHRKIIGDVAKEKEWFKQLGKGEELGEFVFNNGFDDMMGTDFHSKIVELRKWAIGQE